MRKQRKRERERPTDRKTWERERVRERERETKISNRERIYLVPTVTVIHDSTKHSIVIFVKSRIWNITKKSSETDPMKIIQLKTSLETVTD